MHGCARHICVVTIADRQSPERKKFWMHEIRLNIKKRNLAFLSAMIMIITDRGIIRLRLQQGIYHKVPKNQLFLYIKKEKISNTLDIFSILFIIL